MANEIIAAVIGVAGGAALTVLGSAVTGLRSSGEHKRQLDDHETRLDDHAEQLKELPEKYVPRTELSGQLQAMRESQGRTEEWVRFLVKKEVIPPESH